MIPAACRERSPRGGMNPVQSSLDLLAAYGYGSIPAAGSFVLDCLEEGKNILYALLIVLPCEIRARGIQTPPAREIDDAPTL